jgi:hypothetical protein
MPATFEWSIKYLVRDLVPENMNGAVTYARWVCTASQTVGSGDDAVTYTAKSYGTEGFTPDPSASDYIPYADLTEADVLGWCWAGGADKDAIQASLQANIDGQITPTTAEGVPW